MSKESLYFQLAKKLNLGNFDDLMKRYNLTYSEMLGIIDYGLNSNLSLVQLHQLRQLLEKKKYFLSINEDKIGIIADTHIGSKYMNWEYIKMAYQTFDELNITTVLHLGDLFDAFSNLPKNREKRNNIIIDCWEQLLDWQKNYPNGFNNLFVHGNHDERFSLVGIDLCKQIEARREDFLSIGKGACYIKINNFSFSLRHPLESKLIVADNLDADIILRAHSHYFDKHKNMVIISSCSDIRTKFDSSRLSNPGFATLNINNQKVNIDGYVFDDRKSVKILTYSIKK